MAEKLIQPQHQDSHPSPLSTHMEYSPNAVLLKHILNAKTEMVLMSEKTMWKKTVAQGRHFYQGFHIIPLQGLSVI